MNMNNIIFTSLKVLLGALMIIFGLNKFLGFIPVEPPADEIAQTFLGTMFTSYLFKVVAIAEILGGILLLIPRTAFIGTLVLLPVIFNIVAFHLAHDMPGNGIWLGPTFIYVGVLVFYKDKFETLLAS